MSASPAATECAQRVVDLYGEELEAEAGVLHVTSVWQGDRGPPRILRIHPTTPVCETDTFALALARARADAIVTTGQILRDEGDVTHHFEVAGLEAWRAEILGKRRAPQSVVLSSGREIDLRHPIFRSHETLLYTGKGHSPDLPERAKARGVELVIRDAPDLRDLVGYLRDVRGARTVSIEAGATSSRALYHDPPMIDELMLSIYRANLPDAARGPEFFSLPQLERNLPAASHNDSAEADWSFLRLRRSRQASASRLARGSSRDGD